MFVTATSECSCVPQKRVFGGLRRRPLAVEAWPDGVCLPKLRVEALIGEACEAECLMPKPDRI